LVVSCSTSCFCVNEKYLCIINQTFLSLSLSVSVFRSLSLSFPLSSFSDRSVAIAGRQMKDDEVDDNQGDLRLGQHQIWFESTDQLSLSSSFSFAISVSLSLSLSIFCSVHVCEIEAQFKSAAGESNKILLIRHLSRETTASSGYWTTKGF